MKYKIEYMNMVDLGRLFGVSSHQIGKWLKDLGLRRANGTPSTTAYQQKLVSFSYEQWGTYNAVWHVDRVVRILEHADHQQVADLPSDLVELPTLTGPFSLREIGNGKQQIVGNDGEVAITVAGETNAKVVLRVMNIAHRAEMLEKIRATTV